MHAELRFFYQTFENFPCPFIDWVFPADANKMHQEEESRNMVKALKAIGADYSARSFPASITMHGAYDGADLI